MALKNTDVITDTATDLKDRDYLIAKGTTLYAGKTEEERQVLGSKSHTLHFQYLLGLASRQTTRKTSKTQAVSSATPVGIVLVSDEDISVPVIDVLLDKDTGIKPEDIGEREVKAGEEFIVTYYEFMYLIVRDEYACVCCDGDREGGVYFAAKMPAFLNGKTKLPTPTINQRKGAIKQTIVTIDEKDESGQWQIKEPYREKFGKLIQKTVTQRSANQKNAIPTAVAVALAMQEILGIKENEN